MIIVTIPAKSVKLMLDNEIEELAAEASVSLNENLTWMKLTLTDDGYNANKQRIPRDEFKNVIKTGFFMPIKMAQGEISPGHSDTTPLGVMSHLKVNGNTVEALAALWNRERPEDIAYLKELYAKGEPINFSWEITYEEAVATDDGEDFKNVSMNAATIVGEPAYQGRTPATALSSTEKTTEGDNKNMETITLEEHQKAIAELNQKLTDLQKKFDELTDASKKFEDASKKLEEILPEYDELKKFKSDADAKAQRVEKLASIKNKFKESNVEVTDEYIEAKAELFLSMTDDQLNFFVQELVSTLKKVGEGEASIRLTSTNIPPTNPENHTGDVEKKDILEYLRKSDEK